MALLDQFMQSPSTILGLSVLNQADRPAAGLLQGSLLNNRLAAQRSTLESDALRRSLMEQQILKAQQDAEMQKRRREMSQDVFARTPLTGANVQQMASGQIPPTVQSLFERDPQQAITKIMAEDPQMGIQMLNAMKEPAGGTTINVGQEGINEAQKKAAAAYGTPIGERASKRTAEALGTLQMDSDMERIQLALTRGAETGTFQESILDAKSALAGLGIEFSDEQLDRMGEQQIIRAISSKMALWMRNPESGLGLTGNTSNMDLRFLKNAQAGLQNTKEGNLKMIELTMRYNQMKREVAQFQNDIIMREGGIPPLDLDQQVMGFMDSYSFLTDDERAEIEALSKQKESGEETLQPRIIGISDG